MMSELSIGVENRHYAGRLHHRWLIDIKDDAIVFVLKYHHLHSHWRFHIPQAHYRTTTPEAGVQALFWEDNFKATEKLPVMSEDIDQFLISQVSRYYEYPSYRYHMENLKQLLKKTLIKFRKMN